MVYIIKIMNPYELKFWRQKWGLTQAGLAGALGVRNMAVARWEWGTRRISPFLHLALKALEYQFKEGEGNGLTGGMSRVQKAE
jgi:DNA-binding transcriptional regulator YiaG